MKKRIAAQYVYTNSGAPIRNGVVTYDSENGLILDIQPLCSETADTEHYNGVLVPGFVNAHCHLELSNMKGLIPPCRHLIDFLLKVFSLQQTTAYSPDASAAADALMYSSGISIVGDISNVADSVPVKASSKITYVNFIELIGTSPERVARNVDTYNKVSEKFSYVADSMYCAVPHAPYSVSPQMFDAINELNGPRKDVISIHNQETEAENELYVSHQGDFVSRFPIDLGAIPVTGKPSLQSYVHHLKDYKNVLLVHNTFSRREDFAIAQSQLQNPYFVLCPKSNLYLENALPDIDTMLDMNLNLCLGTDSLSSNDTLSILDEMKVLRKNFKQLSFDKLLQMATINGARALNQQDRFGQLNPGIAPGLVLLENFDFQEMNICEETMVRRIV